MNDILLTVEHTTRRLSLEELITVQRAIDKYASELVNATVDKILLWMHGTSPWTEDELLAFLESLKEENP